MTCMICATDTLRGLPMTDKSQLASVARDIVQGMRQGMPATAGIRKQRPGVCAVERCARLIEESCGGCARCQRCSIAAEIRAAEGHINDDRDAELTALMQDDDAIHGVVDQIIESLCGLHAPLGAAMVEECYGRKFLASPAGAS